jgi:hypothetical protein
MKTSILVISFLALTPICKAQTSNKPASEKQIKVHKITIQEVLQTSNYTYLHAKENDSLIWLAVPLMEAKKGETYFYAGGWPMNKFESKELKRTFDDVLFLGGVSVDSNLNSKNKKASDQASIANGHDSNEPYKRTVTPEIKRNIKVDAAQDGVTIAQLFSKKESYAGKTIKIKGEVTKYSPSIMNRNWIHLQDGTNYNNKFDLTVTSASEVKVGQIITVEGKVSLNKDFGYGYLFDVILEEASLK